MIVIFQQRAEMLDMQGSKATVDDAIGLLVAWIDANRSSLNEDDLAIFGEIGGTLYRDGLKGRGIKILRIDRKFADMLRTLLSYPAPHH